MTASHDVAPYYGNVLAGAVAGAGTTPPGSVAGGLVGTVNVELSWTSQVADPAP